MKPELEAIKDAWSKETGEGRDDITTRKLVDEYVAANPELFRELRGMSTARLNLEDQNGPCPDCRAAAGEEHVCPLVRAVSAFRQAGMEESMWHAEIWLLHHFEPQQIGGPMRVRVRRPDGGN